MTKELPGTGFAGRYRLIGPIGQGAIGTVYKALDPVHNRVIALKALGSRTGWPRQALVREARASASLNHPNILKVLDFFEAGGSAFIAMEYIEGRSLADILKEGKPLDQDYVIAIAADVGSALAYAHRRQIVHRDVKPSNILISASGRVVLSDFGLAIASGADTLTSSGTILGTPVYMSPEQAMGRPLDGRSDIYALAIVVYEALSGQPWFRASDTRHVFERLVTTGVEPIRHRNPNVTAAVERVLAKALAKEPADRYQTADQFVQALGDAARESMVFGSRPERSALPVTVACEGLPGYGSWASKRFASLGLRTAFSIGVALIGIVAALFTSRPASVLIAFLVLAVSAWYLFRTRTGAAGLAREAGEPPETSEAVPYSSPSRNPPRATGQAGFVEAPTAETPAYVPSGIPATLTLRDPTAGSWLLVLNGPDQGRQFSLGQTVAIGRSSGNSVVLDNDPAVSRRHAEIVLRESRFHLRDLRSSAGTLVNNVGIQDRELRDRDEIRVGGTTLLFISAAEADESGADAKRRLVEFSAIWNDLTTVAHHDE
jgi:eukaryotic-like serine/threonine-protein kinase